MGGDDWMGGVGMVGMVGMGQVTTCPYVGMKYDQSPFEPSQNLSSFHFFGLLSM